MAHGAAKTHKRCALVGDLRLKTPTPKPIWSVPISSVIKKRGRDNQTFDDEFVKDVQSSVKLDQQSHAADSIKTKNKQAKGYRWRK